MQTRDFPTCCGVTILANFGNRNKYNSRPSKAQVRRFLRDQIATHTMSALLIVTLNKGQKKILGQLFREEGFQCVAVGRALHPIYLMVRRRS